MAKNWDRLSEEVGESLFLDVLVKAVDVVLRLVWWWFSDESGSVG